MNFNIDKMKIVLKSIELKNDLFELKEEIQVGIGVRFTREDRGKSNMLIGVVIFDKNDDIQDTEIQRIELDLEYTIIHNMDIDALTDDEREQVEQEIWRTEYPEIRENVRYICSKVGIPNIIIPFESGRKHG